MTATRPLPGRFHPHHKAVNRINYHLQHANIPQVTRTCTRSDIEASPGSATGYSPIPARPQPLSENFNPPSPTMLLLLATRGPEPPSGIRVLVAVAWSSWSLISRAVSEIRFGLRPALVSPVCPPTPRRHCSHETRGGSDSILYRCSNGGFCAGSCWVGGLHSS